MKLSKKWKNNTLPLYKQAVNQMEFYKQPLDWSDQACLDYFMYETHGTKPDSLDLVNNGCARGNYLLDLHIAVWKDGIEEELFTPEKFYLDNNLSPEMSKYIEHRLPKQITQLLPT